MLGWVFGYTKSMRSYLFASFFILALVPSTALAQSLGSVAEGTPFTVSVRPQ